MCENKINRCTGVQFAVAGAEVMVLIYVLLILASAGFIAVLALHVAALAGSTAFFTQFGKFVFPGLFVIWVPTIFVMSRLTRDFKQKDIWKAALRGCPAWMRTVQWTLMGYAYLVFGFQFLFSGGMNSEVNNARGVSAIVLTFYSIAACVFYSATRADKVDTSRRCANGHRVTPLAKDCEECGAPVLPTSSPDSLT